MDFVIGGLAAMGATLFTNPLDVLKTRIQLQGELKARGKHRVHYKHPYQAFFLVIKKEGVLALQKGLGAALLTQGVHNGIKLGTYQWLTNKELLSNKQNKPIFYKCLIASACAGGLGAFFGTPLYKVTTQLQSHAAKDIAVGFQHKHSSLLQALKNIYIKQGIRGLWHGTNANIVRLIVGSSAQLTSFTEAKEIFNNFEIFQNIPILNIALSGFIAGACQALFQTPFDLVCVRLNNQFIDKNGIATLYSGMLDCSNKIFKAEGFLGFYKGITVNYIKIVRYTWLYLIYWEFLKNYYNTGSLMTTHQLLLYNKNVDNK